MVVSSNFWSLRESETKWSDPDVRLTIQLVIASDSERSPCPSFAGLAQHCRQSSQIDLGAAKIFARVLGLFELVG